MNTDTRWLEDVLDREIEAARLLSIALLAERAALTGDTPAAVNEMATEKVRLLGVIETLENERLTLWAAPGSGAITGPSVAERWRSLMEMMAGNRASNEVNGHIIHIRLNQIRQLLDIVRGGAPATYGPRGKTFAKAPRALARA